MLKHQLISNIKPRFKPNSCSSQLLMTRDGYSISIFYKLEIFMSLQLPHTVDMEKVTSTSKRFTHLLLPGCNIRHCNNNNTSRCMKNFFSLFIKVPVFFSRTSNASWKVNALCWQIWKLQVPPFVTFWVIQPPRLKSKPSCPPSTDSTTICRRNSTIRKPSLRVFSSKWALQLKLLVVVEKHWIS